MQSGRTLPAKPKPDSPRRLVLISFPGTYGRRDRMNSGASGRKRARRRRVMAVGGRWPAVVRRSGCPSSRLHGPSRRADRQTRLARCPPSAAACLLLPAPLKVNLSLFLAAPRPHSVFCRRAANLLPLQEHMNTSLSIQTLPWSREGLEFAFAPVPCLPARHHRAINTRLVQRPESWIDARVS